MTNSNSTTDLNIVRNEIVKLPIKMKRVWFYLSKMAHLRSIGYREVVKTPSRLYELCLTNLVNYLQRCKCDRNMLHTLPDTILIDVYIKVSLEILIDEKHKKTTTVIYLSIRFLFAISSITQCFS